MSSILVIGSANLDLVFRTERFPHPGETILGGEFRTFPGGKGANQAVAIARLGGDVGFVGRVGADPFGDILEASLREARVDTTHLTRSKARPSGTASIVVDAAGNNEIIVAPGANAEVTAKQVREAIALNPACWVLAQLEIPIAAVMAASESVHFVLNPAPACMLSDSLISRCLAITPNETETEILTGVLPFDEETCGMAASLLRKRGARNVVITLGERGCYWMGEEGEESIAPLPVQAVDTVAAGDAFSGALVFALSRGQAWPAALRFATKVAALSTTKQGAQSSMPSIEDCAPA